MLRHTATRTPIIFNISLHIPFYTVYNVIERSREVLGFLQAGSAASWNFPQAGRANLPLRPASSQEVPPSSLPALGKHIVYHIGVIHCKYTLHLHKHMWDSFYCEPLSVNMEKFYWEGLEDNKSNPSHLYWEGLDLLSSNPSQ